MDFDKYKNKMEYPKKPARMCPNCKNPFYIGANFCSFCGNEVGDFYENAMNEYKENQKAYRMEDKRLHCLFEEDVMEYVGLSKHPKRNEIFHFAWDKGHSAGIQNVLNWLEELIDFELV